MRVRFLRTACPACWLLDVSRLIASRKVFRAQGESPAPGLGKASNLFAASRATSLQRADMWYRKLTVLDFERHSRPPRSLRVMTRLPHAVAAATAYSAAVTGHRRGLRVLRRGHRRGHRATARGHRGHRPREPCEGDAVTAGGRTRSPRPPPAVTARGYRAAAPLRHIIGKRSHLPPFFNIFARFLQR